MPFGPGKYGANAAALLAQTDGELCVIIITGGRDGNSFDVGTTNPALVATIPTLLRDTADNIERTLGVQRH
jgi:hypothetical protein